MSSRFDVIKNIPEKKDLIHLIKVSLLLAAGVMIFIATGAAQSLFEAVMHIPVNITFGCILFMGAVYVVGIAFTMIAAVRKVEGCHDVAMSFFLFAAGAGIMGAFGWRFVTGVASQLNTHGMTVMNLYVPGAAFWPLLIIGCTVTISGMPTVFGLIKKAWNTPLELDIPATAKVKAKNMPESLRKVFVAYVLANYRNRAR